MNNFNPIFIPRNHLVEEAIDNLVENNDLSLFNNLLDILKEPFSEKKIKLNLPNHQINHKILKILFVARNLLLKS